PGCFGVVVAMLRAFVNAVDRVTVRLVVDAFNLYLDDQWQYLTTLRQFPVEQIFVYNLDDADHLPLATLEHCHRLVPGNGVIPPHEITHELVQKGYEGTCSPELFNPGYRQTAASQLLARAAGRHRPPLTRYWFRVQRRQ
ncbi:TIM barrel protein, partial [Salmonella enterica]|uniref:TIM barrel protein n=1 Tax=Salmonella enterica TaxID=28901 RepID=UPI00398C819C